MTREQQREAGRRVLAEFIERYGPEAGEEGPERFVREVLGAEPEVYQLDALRAFGRGERRIAFRSCHGVGKTTVAAWLCWIMLLTRFPQKTAITAPTKGQLEDALMAEIGAWHKRLPQPLQELFDVTQHRIELRAAPDESFLTAKTARDETPEALQGVHSDFVLLVADEASGVGEKIFEAAVGSMSGDNAVTLLLGNPTRTSGYFFEAFHSMADLWHTIHVTGVPGTERGHEHRSYYSPRVTADFIEQVARTYGRDSDAFRVRALGEFPRGDADTIIPIELIVAAQERDIVVPDDMTEIWGLDVARYGDDESALVRRNRLAVLPRIETWGGMDLMYTVGRVKRAYDDQPSHLKPEKILVDEIGLGAGVVDRLRELGLPAIGVNVSEKRGVDDRYHNLRTELWFRGRAWLDAANRKLPERCTCGKCSGKDDHALRLRQELARTRYDVADSSGKLLAEPKKSLKKRGYPSPNIADAFLLTLADDVSVMMHGSEGANDWQRYSWSKPIRRRRVVV